MARIEQTFNLGSRHSSSSNIRSRWLRTGIRIDAAFLPAGVSERYLGEFQVRSSGPTMIYLAIGADAATAGFAVGEDLIAEFESTWEVELTIGSSTWQWDHSQAWQTDAVEPYSWETDDATLRDELVAAITASSTDDATLTIRAGTPTPMGWPEAAIIYFDGYAVSYMPTTLQSSDGVGKFVEESYAHYAVKRRDFDFVIPVADVADFLTWQSEQANHFFDFFDPDIGANVRVRLPEGKGSVQLAGSDLRDSQARRLIRGRAALESLVRIERGTGVAVWPYDIVVPEFDGMAVLHVPGEFRRTPMEDGAVVLARVAEHLDRREIDFSFDVLQTDMAAFVAWVEAVDDRAFTLTLPDADAGVEHSVQFVGGMAGVGVRGSGRRTEDGLLWRGTARARMV